MIGEYIKGKPAIYIFVTERKLREQLKQVARQVVEYIGKDYLDKNSYLYQEVKFLLKEEISEPTTYFNILEAISDGETKIGKIGFRPRKISRWWDNSEEIDLVAIGDDYAAFIECKWRSQKVDYTVYNNLTRTADTVNIPPGLKKEYVIF